MGRDGLLIGEVAKRTGVSRKALRLYEAAGILPRPRRSDAGYRVYDVATVALVGFVSRARRLGFTLNEIGEIVAIQRSGRTPCAHVRDLVQRKRAELRRRLDDLAAVRKRLDAVLRGWDSRCGTASVCLHIEQASRATPRRNDHGEEGVTLPVVRPLPRGRAGRG
jgi:DNA-binding transcriptional MerR regulator